MQVTIAGTAGGTGSITGYSNPTTYAISATNGSTTFTLQTLVGGAIVTTAGTPTGLTYTAILTGGAAYLYTDANGVVKFKITQDGHITSGSTQVLQGRIGGYGTPTGGSRTTLVPASATLPQVCALLNQVIFDFQTHGALGT
jgi:hypothetical protein